METTVIAGWRRHLMLASGVFMLLSAMAHSFLGWKKLGPELQATGAGEEMFGSLEVGWHFGGFAMAAFALIVLLAWRRVRQGDAGLRGAIRVMALAYLGFGIWAFVERSFNPFFIVVFVLPGTALAAAAWGGARRAL